MPEIYFKAFIRVVKSIAAKDDHHTGLDTVEVIREPLIVAESKDMVKQILLEKYPQFFQNGKVYEKETKNDKAQFFYVVIFPLYQYELDEINEGEWKCDYCGHVHQNKYISRPLKSQKFEGKIFCGNDYKTGNDIVTLPDCYENFKRSYFKNVDFPDDLNYINADSPVYIYKITEKSTAKCYVGKTKNAPFFRWWNHLKHSKTPFGLYIRATKLSGWSFEVLEELPSNISDTEVFSIESKYIREFNSIENGYNSVISNKNERLD